MIIMSKSELPWKLNDENAEAQEFKKNKNLYLETDFCLISVLGKVGVYIKFCFTNFHNKNNYLNFVPLK